MHAAKAYSVASATSKFTPTTIQHRLGAHEVVVSKDGAAMAGRT